MGVWWGEGVCVWESSFSSTFAVNEHSSALAALSPHLHSVVRVSACARCGYGYMHMWLVCCRCCGFGGSARSGGATQGCVPGGNTRHLAPEVLNAFVGAQGTFPCPGPGICYRKQEVSPIATLSGRVD